MQGLKLSVTKAKQQDNRSPSSISTAHCLLLTARCSSPASVLAIILGFFGPSLTNMSLVLERYQPTGIFLHLIDVSTMVRAPVASRRRNRAQVQAKYQ